MCLIYWMDDGQTTDLNRLLQVYQFWAHKMYPKTQFKDTVDRVEKLCHSKRMHVRLPSFPVFVSLISTTYSTGIFKRMARRSKGTHQRDETRRQRRLYRCYRLNIRYRTRFCFFSKSREPKETLTSISCHPCRC